MSDITIGVKAITKVSFLDATGKATVIPAGTVINNQSNGTVTTISLDPTVNADGSYTLTVTPVGLGEEVLSVAGLSGSLAFTVVAAPAVSVSFGPLAEVAG
jgi:hypothetical protein